MSDTYKTIRTFYDCNSATLWNHILVSFQQIASLLILRRFFGRVDGFLLTFPSQKSIQNLVLD